MYTLSEWLDVPVDKEIWFETDDPRVPYPVMARGGTSDFDVLLQIFGCEGLREEYGCLAGIGNVGLVIDCGANVGYSSIWFLTRFSGCRVIAIEPDPGNYAVLCRNLKPYGDRAIAIRAGVWPTLAKLKIDENQDGYGREWGRQVRKCDENERNGFPGLTIDSILFSSGHNRISVLKMDIEGSESLIFSDGDLSWLDVTDVIAIELHDWTKFGDASGPFLKAVRSRGFGIHRAGEITIAMRGLADA